jgi:hypothetical protein
MIQPRKSNTPLFKLFFLFIIACTTAYYITLVLIDQHPHTQVLLTSFVRSMLTTAFDAPVSLTVQKIRIGTGKAYLHNVHIQAKNSTWHWDIGTLELNFSLWDTICTRALVVQVQVYNSILVSSANNEEIAIAPTLVKLFSTSSSNQSVAISRIIITPSLCKLAHPNGTITVSYAADLPLTTPQKISRFWWHNGTVDYSNAPILREIAGFYAYNHTKNTAHLQCITTLLVPQSPPCTLKGDLKKEGNVWHATILPGTTAPTHPYYQCDSTISIDEQTKNLSLTSTVPYALIASFLKIPLPCRGTVVLSGSAQLNNMAATAQGSLELKIATWGDTGLPHIALEAQPYHRGFQAHITCAGVALETELYQRNNSYHISSKLLENIPLSSTFHLTSGSSCTLTYDGQGSYSGTTHCMFKAPQQPEAASTGQPESTLTSQLNCTYTGNFTACTLTGSCGSYTFSAHATTEPHMHLQALELKEHKTVLLKLFEKDGLLQGQWDIRLITLLLQPLVGTYNFGEGTATFKGNVTPTSLRGTCTIDDATLRIPSVYNIIEGISFDADINWKKRAFTLKNATLQLHQGKAYSSLLQGSWNSHGLEWMTMPYVAENCLLSWKKDLFGLVSGSGMITYESPQWAVKGSLTLERGHMRNNILSLESTVPLSTDTRASKKITPVLLDIKLRTRKPISVKSSFLDTQFHTALSLQGTHSAPSITGDITMAEGSILFPYKPLFIRHGKATLNETPPVTTASLHNKALEYGMGTYDPQVSLLAENTIKGYRIRMNIQGSLKNPELTFSSIPHLPQEQIIALLFGGSEDGSIYVAMSSYVMQSIKDLLFSPDNNSSALLQSLKNLFKPLGTVRFVPSFTDQSSRGGIRGSLALEVNDRLRGTIKQNFELPQDVLLEVEYDLSDEARIRAIKDERGDLGAEIEASWKF